MGDFYLDFMKPDIWDGLVLGTILIGLSLAVLRLISDRAAFKRSRDRANRDKENK